MPPCTGKRKSSTAEDSDLECAPLDLLLVLALFSGLPFGDLVSCGPLAPTTRPCVAALTTALLPSLLLLGLPLVYFCETRAEPASRARNDRDENTENDPMSPMEPEDNKCLAKSTFVSLHVTAVILRFNTGPHITRASLECDANVPS